MKIRILITFLLLQICTFSQTLKQSEQKLNKIIEKQNYWFDKKNGEYNEFADDSLAFYNDAFENQLLHITNTFPESIRVKLTTLEKSISIFTSADGNFRIYNWDTFEGGTMHFFKNIIQYKSGKKVKALVFNSDDDDPGCSFYELNQVTSQKKNFYITSSVVIGSSAVYYYEAKVFSIDDGNLNLGPKLIKTKSGMQNCIGYEMDFSNEANRNNTYFSDRNLSDFDYDSINYDKKTNTIILPLLDENGKLTVKKIKYQFNGVYFEKVKSKK